MVCGWQEAVGATPQPQGQASLLCPSCSVDKVVLPDASAVEGWALPSKDAAGAVAPTWCKASQHETSASSDPKPFLLGLMLLQPGAPSSQSKVGTGCPRGLLALSLFSQRDWSSQPER